MTGSLAPTIPANGDPEGTAEQNVASALVTLRNGLNAVLTSGNALDLTQSNATYTAYTPTWTNLTVGNGTTAGRYARVNKIVVMTVQMIFGSTSSMGTSPTVSLPVTAANNLVEFGVGSLTDASPAATWDGRIYRNTATTAALFYVSSDYRAITSLIPFTWTTSDSLNFSLTYEAA